MKQQKSDTSSNSMPSIVKNRRARIYVVVAATLACSPASAYELGTHARLTYTAYMESALAQDQSLIQSLGIDLNLGANQNNPFGDIYYDVSGTTVRERPADTFEARFMVERKDNPSPILPARLSRLSLPGWLLRGAIREDDSSTEPNPHDDASYNPGLKRPLNHFFDPVNNRPLTVPGLPLVDSNVHKAPDWALGTQDVFIDPTLVETGHRNHFTLLDAREAEYRALTGHDGQGNPIAPAVNGTLTTPEAIRKAYWATTFRVSI